MPGKKRSVSPVKAKNTRARKEDPAEDVVADDDDDAILAKYIAIAANERGNQPAPTEEEICATKYLRKPYSFRTVSLLYVAHEGANGRAALKHALKPAAAARRLCDRPTPGAHSRLRRLAWRLSCTTQPWTVHAATGCASCVGPGSTRPWHTTQFPSHSSHGMPFRQSGHMGQPQRTSCGYGDMLM